MLTTINNNASTWLAMQQLIHSSNFFISIDEVERHKVGYLHTGDLQQLALYMLQCGIMSKLHACTSELFPDLHS